MTMQSDSYEALSQALDAAGVQLHPAECHGMISGALCLRDDVSAVLGAAIADKDVAPEAPPLLLPESIAEWVEEVNAALRDEQMGFRPYLPADDAPLPERIEALALWCQGFLYGLAGAGTVDLDAQSTEAREGIENIVEISRADPDSGIQAGEAGERQFTELVEFVRVAAQLIYLELQPPAAGQPASQQLH